MKKIQHTMQLVTVLYFIIAGLILWLMSKKLSGDWLLQHMFPLALGLIVFWFILIFLTLKIQNGGKKK